ncbi:FAD-dependent oxidoreductase [Arenibaculum pallidiluteum]|uniref:FAD-dependent oxidoreductase n=1 Tax=Arenibaculum pallidiluteum TaxID=2812559 RepID=UPI001A9668AE|nr:NAD(P)/FAD-dependent oxidoreductase [Arenibaculum pallidiluteum]
MIAATHPLPGETTVAIIGSGPTGLAVAIGLAQRGIDFVILDRLHVRETTSRAAVIHARTLEELEHLGVRESLIGRGLKAHRFRVRERDRVLMHADFSCLPSPNPYALMIPQDETEAILIERLEALGGAVTRPAEVVAIVPHPNETAVRYVAMGRSGSLRARYVVGADGQNSLTRQAAGIGFPGQTYGSFLLADVRMTWPITTDEVSLFFSREGTLVVAPMTDRRFRIVAQLADAPSAPTIKDVQSLIDRRGPWTGVQVRELIWGSRFQVHHKLAETFRAGPLLLAGDAAHVHSPAGGQGMNLGLRDAIALSAALAFSLQDSGADKPLDAYALEQRTEARRVLDLTHRLTTVATLRSPALRVARNALISTAARFPPVRDRVARLLAGYS